MLIRSQNVRMNELTLHDVAYITEEINAGMNRSKVQSGDVLLNITGASIGRVACFDIDGVRANVNQHVCIIRSKPNGFAPRYLTHLISSPEFQSEIDRLQHGGTRQALTFSQISEFKIPLPPLAEQRRIADVLDRAEALRAKRRAALAQLDSLTQSLFLDLFGDPISNPKEWPTARFEDLCHRVTVGIVVRPSSYYVANGVPALRSLNVKPGKIVLDDVVYFSESDNENQLKKTRLLAGDLVLVRTGQPGTAAVVPPELDGVNAIDLLITTPRITVVSAKFLCEFFNSSGGRDLVLSAQRGQIQKHLNVGSLAEAVIPLPPLKLQHEFARRVTAVETLKTAHRTSLAELDSLFATLQHRAFRGEL